jgi:uncharacterized membrane protein YeaQ/YmgE (transglycosylase-associated protein family)
MSAQSLLIILLVGGIAGWLAGMIVRGTGFGVVADIALGIVGAFIGSWLLPRFHIHIGSGFVNEIVIAPIGALVLLLILGLFARHGGGGGAFLTPPSYAVFLISVVIAVVAFLIHYGGVRIPLPSSVRVFDVLSVAYVVLLIGVLFRGL